MIPVIEDLVAEVSVRPLDVIGRLLGSIMSNWCHLVIGSRGECPRSCPQREFMVARCECMNHDDVPDIARRGAGFSSPSAGRCTAPAHQAVSGMRAE